MVWEKKKQSVASSDQEVQQPKKNRKQGMTCFYCLDRPEEWAKVQARHNTSTCIPKKARQCSIAAISSKKKQMLFAVQHLLASFTKRRIARIVMHFYLLKPKFVMALSLASCPEIKMSTLVHWVKHAGKYIKIVCISLSMLHARKKRLRQASDVVGVGREECHLLLQVAVTVSIWELSPQHRRELEGQVLGGRLGAAKSGRTTRRWHWVNAHFF